MGSDGASSQIPAGQKYSDCLIVKQPEKKSPLSLESPKAKFLLVAM